MPNSLPAVSENSNHSGNPMTYAFASKPVCRVLIVASIMFFAAASVQAQTRVRHELIRGDMPPGLAADYYRMSQPELAHYVQPVRIVGPTGSKLEYLKDGQFVGTDKSKASFGMQIGPVYRIKVTDIPEHKGKVVYPSVEVLNRLYPPEGLANDFPIQVVIELDDLRQALNGNLVTKVIYLEDPETALPHRHREDMQPYFDVGGGEDPLRAAEKMGRPMAILRIGSRVPVASDAQQQFDFHAPGLKPLPDPKAGDANTPTEPPKSASTADRGEKLPPIRVGALAPIIQKQR